jgi:metal-responsive CopG/Arc/MetJ family transcriptional regulator
MTMAKLKIKPPKALKSRLEDVAKKHDFDSAKAVLDHFIMRGLKVYNAPQDLDLAEQLEHVVDEQGYSSRDELIEHLLLRGLRAYEEAETDPSKLEARLRGLGYID